MFEVITDNNNNDIDNNNDSSVKYDRSNSSYNDTVVDNNKNGNNDEIKMPKKKYFRTRAHCNPLSNNDGFSYPISPHQYNWQLHYPMIYFSNYHKDINSYNTSRINGVSSNEVSILDIGMGFGGLSVELAQLFPNKLILGRW